MPKTIPTSIQELTLDLNNFRTVAQSDEVQAIQAMISISPDRFWALTDSLIDDGYLPTENILVLRADGLRPDMIVKEGNRRIAALKLIHGYLPADRIDPPEFIASKIATISGAWKEANKLVPCAIYSAKDASVVDRIITLAHGKGEKAGRDQWNAVARARHNRDVNNASEPALDLLEQYLKCGKNLTKQQGERWAGDYPLTVLEEAIKKLSPRFEASNASDLAKKYPSTTYRDALEAIVKDIGSQSIRFETIRADEDFAAKYGVPRSTNAGNAQNAAGNSGFSSNSRTTSAGSGGAQGKPLSGRKMAAVAINDPRSVIRALRRFAPRGDNRQKVVTLRDEAIKLKLDKNPIAFCFLLRSMFEISAKAYCEDHKNAGGPKYKKANGDDKALGVILKEIADHLTQNNADKAMVKTLHGAMVELGRSIGILSVTSMNQLVHSPSFSVAARDIAILFQNIFGLLEAING